MAQASLSESFFMLINKEQVSALAYLKIPYWVKKNPF